MSHRLTKTSKKSCRKPWLPSTTRGPLAARNNWHRLIDTYAAAAARNDAGRESFALWVLAKLLFDRLAAVLAAEFTPAGDACPDRALFGRLKLDRGGFDLDPHCYLPLFFGPDILTRKRLREGLRAWLNELAATSDTQSPRLIDHYPRLLDERRRRLKQRAEADS